MLTIGDVLWVHPVSVLLSISTPSSAHSCTFGRWSIASPSWLTPLPLSRRLLEDLEEVQTDKVSMEYLLREKLERLVQSEIEARVARMHQVRFATLLLLFVLLPLMLLLLPLSEPFRPPSSTFTRDMPCLS